MIHSQVHLLNTHLRRSISRYIPELHTPLDTLNQWTQNIVRQTMVLSTESSGNRQQLELRPGKTSSTAYNWETNVLAGLRIVRMWVYVRLVWHELLI